MNPLTQFKRMLIFSFVIAPALGALVVPLAAQASEVTHWNEIAINTLVQFPPAAGGAAPALQIDMGMTQGAVYDALNAIEPRHHRPYLLNRRFAATASKEAAAATAAYKVLSNIVQTVPPSIPFPNRMKHARPWTPMRIHRRCGAPYDSVSHLDKRGRDFGEFIHTAN